MNHIKTYLTLVLITLAFASFAQKKKQISKAEKPEYRVYYQHQHIRDLAHPEVVHQEEMMLLVGQKTSLFTSYDKLRLTYENENELQKQLKSGNRQINFPTPRILTSEEYVIQYDSPAIYTLTYLFEHVGFMEEVEPIKWEITTEEKQIEGMKVIKATTNYKERDWEVWYTPEIPHPAGPALLRGLPGLILEAQDKQKEVSYLVSKIETTSRSNPVIKSLPDYNRVRLSFFSYLNWMDKNQFNEMREYARNHNRDFKISQNSKVSGTRTNPFFTVLSNDDSWLNPIENPVFK